VGSKNKTKTTENKTTTVAPPSWTMPGISNVADQVTQAAMGLSSIPAYNGNYTATPDMGLINGAIDAYKGTAASAGNYSALLGGKIGGLQNYDVGSMQDVQPVIKAALSPVYDQLTKVTLPGLRTSAADAGAYSGSRAGSILPALALDDYNKTAGDLATKIGYQNYTDFEDRRLKGAELDQNQLKILPDLINAALATSAAGGDTLAGAAQLGQTAAQAGISNDLAKYNAQFTQPFQGLDLAAALLSQLSGNYGTTNTQGTSTQVQSTGGLGPIVQGLAGVASAAGAFAGAPGGGAGLSSLFKSANPFAGLAGQTTNSLNAINLGLGGAR
jgi:hypothetical protein